MNFGKVRQKGIELGVDTPITHEVSGYVNYSYQPSRSLRASTSPS